jgi:hypothetical protein
MVDQSNLIWVGHQRLSLQNTDCKVNGAEFSHKSLQKQEN